MRPRSTGQAARRAERRRNLPPGAACMLCGESEPELLRQVGRRLLEKHHHLGRANDPEATVTLCRNCHWRCSLGQLDDAVPLASQETALERDIAALLNLASFFQQCGAAIGRLVATLIRHREGLDRDHPDWRKRPWAR